MWLQVQSELYVTNLLPQSGGKSISFHVPFLAFHIIHNTLYFNVLGSLRIWLQSRKSGTSHSQMGIFHFSQQAVLYNLFLRLWNSGEQIPEIVSRKTRRTKGSYENYTRYKTSILSLSLPVYLAHSTLPFKIPLLRKFPGFPLPFLLLLSFPRSGRKKVAFCTIQFPLKSPQRRKCRSPFARFQVYHFSDRWKKSVDPFWCACHELKWEGTEES